MKKTLEKIWENKIEDIIMDLAWEGKKYKESYEEDEETMCKLHRNSLIMDAYALVHAINEYKEWSK